jgi:Holliday junction resolvase-like predicted endonuclease
MITATQEHETGLTFEKVWAALMETRVRQEETDRQIGRLSNRQGELIEALTASNLVEKVNACGFRFTRISRNIRIKDEKNKVKAEIDILLEDGEYAMVVEVKTNLTKTDVKEGLERMDTLRRHADAHGDKRKYVCSGVAGALIEDGAREYALNQGLYVIKDLLVLEHPGQTIEILAPPQRCEW